MPLAVLPTRDAGTRPLAEAPRREAGNFAERSGPGLLESVYETVLAYELTRRGFEIEREKPIPVQYDELVIPDAFRADLVVSRLVSVELKSVDGFQPVHAKQVITYLRLTGLRAGLLINFNNELLKSGIKRFVNGLDE